MAWSCNIWLGHIIWLQWNTGPYSTAPLPEGMKFMQVVFQLRHSSYTCKSRGTVRYGTAEIASTERGTGTIDVHCQKEFYAL